MSTRGTWVLSPPKRVPSGATRGVPNAKSRTFPTVLSYHLLRRYSLCTGLDAMTLIPGDGNLALTATAPVIDLNVPMAKMLQPMWRNSVPSKSFFDFWLTDWPRVRALRIRALKSCLTTILSVDSANLVLLRDRFTEAQQEFISAQQVYEQDQELRYTCQVETLKDTALLGYAGRKVLAGLSGTGGHVYGTDGVGIDSSLFTAGGAPSEAQMQDLSRRMTLCHKKMVLTALRLRVLYTRNMQRLSAAVITENDAYMLLRGALLAWHRKYTYRARIVRINDLLASIIDAHCKRRCFYRWFSDARTSATVRKEKLMRKLLQDSMVGTNVSYPEPSILSSPHITRPGSLEESTSEKAMESYLNRLYNIFIAVGTKLNDQTRAFLALTDYSMVITLIARISRIRRKLLITRLTSSSINSPYLKSLLQSPQTGANLDAFGHGYFTLRVLQRSFSNLRDMFYRCLLHRLAMMYAACLERARVLRTLSICLHVQRRCTLVARHRVLYRVSFSCICRSYKERVNEKYGASDSFYTRMLVFISLRNMVYLSRLYMHLSERAEGLIRRVETRHKIEAFRHFLLAYSCIVFRDQHIDNRRNFRYRTVFWTMHQTALQRRALRTVLANIALPRYKALLQLESYYTSRTYHRELCANYFKQWRQAVLASQKVQQVHILTQQADRFYSSRLLCFVLHLLLIKARQKIDSRLFYYRHQVILVRNALRQWNARLHSRNRAGYLGSVLREIWQCHNQKYTEALFAEVFYIWWRHSRATLYYNNMLQRQAFRLMCACSFAVKHFYTSLHHYERSLMRRAYIVLTVHYQYASLLSKLDRRYNIRLLHMGLLGWRTKHRSLVDGLENAKKFYNHCLLARVCKALELVAARSKIYMEACTIGTKYIKVFYLRRWKTVLRASREAIYLEKRADCLYRNILDRWADKILANPHARTDIPVHCLTARTSKELIETGLIGSIVLSSKMLKAHLIVENQLLLMIFDEWRYAVVRRKRFISMRGPV